MKIAWGVTGSGDKLIETYEVMKALKKKHGNKLIIEVFLSKAGEKVAKFYRLSDELERFDKHWVEKDANTPFLSGRLQLNEFDILLVAPATSNTVAKIAVGISDSLISNSAIQAIKGFIPVYIMPVDYHEGTITTTIPDGRKIKLRVRKEDADNVRTLEDMEGIIPFEEPGEIPSIIERILNTSE
ncbi:MAG: archaeoflavoprotein AfpA [Candidatus Bathyarchaeota archaeon]|nr:archaeoflavoprotein AfpA [Candidatus Bathyarchaeota archaeon]